MLNLGGENQIAGKQYSTNNPPMSVSGGESPKNINKNKQPTTGWKRFVSIDKKNDVRITTEKLEKRVYCMNLTRYDKATVTLICRTNNN